MPKDTPSKTVSRKRFDDVHAALGAALATQVQLEAQLDQMRTERREARERADRLQADLDSARQQAKDQEARAARAEGFATALHDQRFPARPSLPWEVDAINGSFQSWRS